MSEFKEITRKFAHDVRNPLGGVIGCAELLKLDLPENPKWKRRVSGILSAASKIDELIAELQKSAVSLSEGEERVSDSEGVNEVFSLVTQTLRQKKDLNFSLGENASHVTVKFLDKESNSEIFSVKVPKKSEVLKNV